MNEQSKKMYDLLSKAGVATHEVKVYGSQVVVGCYSEAMAERAANLLAAAKMHVRKILPMEEHAKENKNTVLVPTTRTIWTVFARV